jgi:hypothetical protein
MPMKLPLLEINGTPARADTLSAALQNYGHFTSMQIRDGGVRGLALHLQRLQQSTRLLFGHELDTAQSASRWRSASSCGALRSRSSAPSPTSTAPAA